MNTEEIKNNINQYFDNDLTKNEEAILFTQLSQDDIAREYFKEMNLLNSAIDSTMEKYPDKLDAKIFANLKREESTGKIPHSRSKIYTAISYGFALFLLALSFYFYRSSIQYRDQVELTSQQVYQQNQMIKVLFNSLPQTEVRAEFANEIIVTPQM